MRSAHDLTYLLISHDLRMVAHLADEIAVLQAGKIVERGSAAKILSQPVHPHTRQLLAAAPMLDRQ